MIPLLMGAPNQQDHNAMTGFVVSSPTRPSHTVYLERVRARGRHDSPERRPLPDEHTHLPPSRSLNFKAKWPVYG